MARLTIRDLAQASGLSVATVNRVLHEPSKVRDATIRSVLEAAERIGFYGLGTIRASLTAARRRVRIGVLLLQRNRSLYRSLARELEAAAGEVVAAQVAVRIEHLEDISPQSTAEGLARLAEGSDVVGVVAAEHPVVAAAIESLAERGVPVVALISLLAARCPVGYIGLDTWKVGRTAGWAFDNLCRAPGKIGILVGNHRFRSQETNESGFRSYFREHPRGFDLLEPLSTFESSSIAREMTERLLAAHPDLAGLYVSGGGISGSLAALRESGRAQEVVAVGYDLTEATREGLLDGSLNLVIAHPLQALAREAVAAMVQAAGSEPGGPLPAVRLPLEIFTPENL